MKLDDKMKELIAIGASISANCLPCLEYHVGKASELGCESSEIKEAIEVGTLVRRGAASKMDKFSNAVVTNEIPVKKLVNDGCGCNGK
jgi:AhpD family alkylhydroperoxidase